MKSIEVFHADDTRTRGAGGGGPTSDVEELLCFLRGLDAAAYAVSVHSRRTEPTDFAERKLGDAQLPFVAIEGQPVCVGACPTPQEISDLLRLGCEGVTEDLTCCQEVWCCGNLIRAAPPAVDAGEPKPNRAPSGRRKQTVLFICRYNTCRSQMAEAFLRQEAGDRFEVFSCGLESRPVHRLTIAVLQEIGLDIRQQESKECGRFLGRLSVNYAIFVCHVHEDQCPKIFPFAMNHVRWPFQDPTTAPGTEDEQLAVFRRVRDEIRDRILAWLVALPVE